MFSVNNKLLNTFGFILFLGINSCQKNINDEIAIFIPENDNYTYGNIFYQNNKYYFINWRDSSEVKKINEDSIQLYSDFKFYKYKSKIMYDFDYIEASNYEHDNFYAQKIFIFDLKLIKNELWVKIIAPEIYKNSYKIILTNAELNLIRGNIINFEKIKTESKKESRFGLSVNFKNKTKTNLFIKNEYTADISLFYDSIMFILIKHIKRDKNYEIIKDSIVVKTAQNFLFRYPPPFPPNE